MSSWRMCCRDSDVLPQIWRLPSIVCLHVMLPRLRRRGIVNSVHAHNVVTVKGNGVVNISRLQEGEDVVEMFGIAEAHCLAMTETPQPERRSSEIVPKIDALFRAVIMSSICHMRVLRQKCGVSLAHAHML